MELALDLAEEAAGTGYDHLMLNKQSPASALPPSTEEEDCSALLEPRPDYPDLNL